MSTKISDLAPVTSLDDSYLFIAEKTGEAPETQKTNLGDIKEWLDNQFDNKYISSEDIEVTGINLNKNILDNKISLNFDISDWNNSITYQPKDIVIFSNCLYICLNTIKSEFNPSEDNVNWKKLNYTAGRRVVISNDNTISSIGGIENFSELQEYEQYDFVIYDNKLYQSKHYVSAGNWNKNDWDNIGEGNGIIVYENDRTYKSGDIVIKDNTLYKRKNIQSSGPDVEWIPENWICISNANYSKIYIKYSAVYPTQDADMLDSPNRYIGICNGSENIAPQHYTDYQWFQIQENINVECNTIVKNITILTSDWVGSSPAIATYTDSFYTSGMAPIVNVQLSNDTTKWQEELDNFNKITRVVSNNGSITFYCIGDVPDKTVNVYIRVNGDVNSNSFVTRTEFNILNSRVETLIGQLNSNLEQALAGE